MSCKTQGSQHRCSQTTVSFTQAWIAQECQGGQQIHLVDAKRGPEDNRVPSVCERLSWSQPGRHCNQPIPVPRQSPAQVTDATTFPLKQVSSVSAGAPAQQPAPATPNPHEGTTVHMPQTKHSCMQWDVMCMQTHSALATTMIGGHMHACPQLGAKCPQPTECVSALKACTHLIATWRSLVLATRAAATLSVYVQAAVQASSNACPVGSSSHVLFVVNQSPAAAPCSTSDPMG